LGDRSALGDALQINAKRQQHHAATPLRSLELHQDWRAGVVSLCAMRCGRLTPYCRSATATGPPPLDALRQRAGRPLCRPRGFSRMFCAAHDRLLLATGCVRAPSRLATAIGAPPAMRRVSNDPI
jgi:hypothetical protein